MNRRLWAIAAPAAVLTLTFLVFAWLSAVAPAAKSGQALGAKTETTAPR